MLESAESARRFTLPQRYRLGFELIDVLSGLQAVDLDAGLATMRRGTPYLERQIRRWNAQWTATASRVVPAIDDVRPGCRRSWPALSPQPDCLVHGDFRFGNVMVTHEPEPGISALLDWELATTGHPLADLGFLWGKDAGACRGSFEPGPAARRRSTASPS